MTPRQQILAAYRATSQTEREKGTYFEELIRTYFHFENRKSGGANHRSRRIISILTVSCKSRLAIGDPGDGIWPR